MKGQKVDWSPALDAVGERIVIIFDKEGMSI